MIIKIKVIWQITINIINTNIDFILLNLIFIFFTFKNKFILLYLQSYRFILDKLYIVSNICKLKSGLLFIDIYAIKTFDIFANLLFIKI